MCKMLSSIYIVERAIMYRINIKARAKINISLDVLGKREDGYHDVKMIMQTVNLYDKINLKKKIKK